jgi:23S rRNA (pseudouridine1915-N3)-methyltransferase
MNLKLYFFGNSQDLIEREKELIRRLNFQGKLEILPLKPIETKEPLQVKKLETAKLLTKIKQQDFIILLDERGKQIDSLQFAKFSQEKFIAHQQLIFVIGGAHGVDEELRNRANFQLSFGSMVWTKDLCRLMLLEQLYRASEILAGKNFHKN